MKSSPSLYSCLLLMSPLFAAEMARAATVVYSESFTSTTLVSQANPYLGGWFTPQTAFQIWNGPAEASITTGALTVTSTNGTRSAGVFLSPGIFPQAGNYTLSFDVTAYSGNSNNHGLVTVWAGSGYDLSHSTGNSLVLDTLAAGLTTSGTATASSLGSLSITSAGSGMQISFNYDGSSAVALFFGANTIGWPFPTATYDNIAITQNTLTPVPESSVVAFVGLGTTAMCLGRRRLRRMA